MLMTWDEGGAETPKNNYVLILFPFKLRVTYSLMTILTHHNHRSCSQIFHSNELCLFKLSIMLLK